MWSRTEVSSFGKNAPSSSNRRGRSPDGNPGGVAAQAPGALGGLFARVSVTHYLFLTCLRQRLNGDTSTVDDVEADP
jgi:hypothetical protein